MATKRKSIIEEALLEAKSLEDALKANTKEMLANHMKQEIENIVESSLKEDEEEIEIDVEQGSDEKMEEMPALAAGEDLEGDAEEADSEESELMDFDVDLDALAADGDDDEVELTVAELPSDLDMGDEEELDLTGASDEEVIAVFKKMSDEDEVEVVKDADGIHLTDNETGAEYYIKEGDEHHHHMEEDDHYEESYKIDEKSDCMKEEAGCGKHNHEGEDGDQIVYEIEMDDMNDAIREEDMEEVDDTIKEEDVEEMLDLDRKEEIDEDEITEDKTKQRKHGQRYHGAKLASESKKTRKPLSNKKPKNVERVAESKIMKEYKELKSKNEEYKGALKVFKNKLNEVALFNTNLAYVNRLFTEHSTTKSEKMEILKRFDSAETIKESKNIYKSVKSELETKKPITESVENKVNKTVKSSKSDLNESTAYVDPQITAIKDLMRKLS